MKFFSRLFYVFIFSMFYIFNSLSAPMFNVPITIEQPNGVIINCFASGDEFYNWAHDKDNYTIVQDEKTGYYYYAILENDKLVPSKYLVGTVNPNLVGLVKGVNVSSPFITNRRNQFFKNAGMNYQDQISSSTIGYLNSIVIFIRFADEPEFTDNLFKYDSMFNSVTERSLKNYYIEASYNQIDINANFFPKSISTVLSYQDVHPRAYYRRYNATTNPTGYKDSAEQKRYREHELLKNAINYISSQVPTNLDIDRNNDGRVDNVIFVIYGNVDAWNDLLWPHAWSLYSNSAYINNKRVYSYSFQLQKSLGVTVLCHEMGHNLGAPDLYHYNNQGKIQPCGVWDIMDNGSGHMCAYLKWKYFGWIPSLTLIDKSGTYFLNHLQSSTNNCYKIKSPNSDSEYFVVEYRKQNGMYDGGLPGNGMLIYRINTLRSGNAGGPPDEVYLYRPGGLVDANGTPNNAFFNKIVGRFVFNDNSNPACFLTNGKPGGLNITDVGIPGETISFTFNAIEPSKNEYSVQSKIYSWVDISKTGTKINNWKNGNMNNDESRDDGWTKDPIPLGFDFKFYGQTYNSIYVGVNGLVSFTQKVLNSAAAFGSEAADSIGFFDDRYKWPGNSLFPYSIAVAYMDWDLSKSDTYGNGEVYYYTLNSKFILSWENIGFYESNRDTLNSFQLILDKLSHSITIQFKNIGQETTKQRIIIGIQKDSSNGLSWVNKGDPFDRIPSSQSAVWFYPSNETSIKSEIAIKQFKLEQNYPNPFNPSTNISYTILTDSWVTLRIYDALGREIKTLVNENLTPGTYSTLFDATGLSSGIYFYRLQADSRNEKQNYIQMKKMILIR